MLIPRLGFITRAYCKDPSTPMDSESLNVPACGPGANSHFLLTGLSLASRRWRFFRFVPDLILERSCYCASPSPPRTLGRRVPQNRIAGFRHRRTYIGPLGGPTPFWSNRFINSRYGESYPPWVLFVRELNRTLGATDMMSGLDGGVLR
jgi:hypothetical protein